MTHIPLEPASDQGDYIKTVERLREQLAKIHAQYREQLPMWTVYGPNTSDQPGMYLARMFLTLPEAVPTNVLIRAVSLAEIRDLLPEGLTVLPRSAEDDINIIETWV